MLTIKINSMKEEELKQKVSVIVSDTTTSGNEKRDRILDLFGVSRSTILNGSHELGERNEKYRRDCKLIHEALVQNGYVNAGLHDALWLWDKYSASYAAGWMGLPDEPREIFDCVKHYIASVRIFVY